MKKLSALLLALVMTLGLATTAFAQNITFTGGAPGATYSAYKLLNSSHDGGDVYAYTLNDTYTAILQAETGKTTEKDIIDYISDLNADGIRKFADNIYAKIKAAGLDADYTTVDDTIEGAVEGYYLIAETELGGNINGATDTRSLVMIDTVGQGDMTIITKESVPTIDKEVYEVNDSTGVGHWGEHADYDVGDTINYRITSTVSGQYEKYINYWYQIEDTMDPGLTFDEGSLVVEIGGVDVTDDPNLTITKEDHKFVITGDLKELDADRDDLTITHNTTVVVTYDCILNENAVSGVPGNPNKVQLKFQNDPYVNVDPTEPGKTPFDTNIVFTYDAVVNKVNGAGDPLAGAGFTLYKWDNKTNGWAKVGSEITGVTTFNFHGLDSGVYKLEESTVPAGYSKIDDIEFTIEAVYNTDEDPVKLTALKVVDRDGDEISSFTIDMTPGKIMTNVENHAGTELPTTGGMGTTLFYVIGGLMVAAAGVLLVTKKRMGSED